MKRLSTERRCSYVVILDNRSRSIDDLRDLAVYLSRLSLSGYDVIIVDGSLQPLLEQNCRVLRWVGRYFVARPQHFSAFGAVDAIRAAIDLNACEKIIVADPQVRYSDDALEETSLLLDFHEVVEPQDYFDPLPWWGGIEAGRMLVQRSLDPLAERGSTFAFRRRAIRALRAFDPGVRADDYVRRLASQGAEVFSAFGIFVRRLPPALSEWIGDLPRKADAMFDMPARAVFFFILLPVAIALALLGGFRFAVGYAGGIALLSVALAIRGRIGAAAFFPLRACLYAPLWLLERSISVYWALLWKVSGGREPRRVAMSVRTGQRVASGE